MCTRYAVIYAKGQKNVVTVSYRIVVWDSLRKTNPIILACVDVGVSIVQKAWNIVTSDLGISACIVNGNLRIE